LRTLAIMNQEYCIEAMIGRQFVIIVHKIRGKSPRWRTGKGRGMFFDQCLLFWASCRHWIVMKISRLQISVKTFTDLSEPCMCFWYFRAVMKGCPGLIRRFAGSIVFFRKKNNEYICCKIIQPVASTFPWTLTETSNSKESLDDVFMLLRWLRQMSISSLSYCNILPTHVYFLKSSF
jgi:hypothetical protein